MKTTVELSDDLYRRVKADAALRGRKVKDLIEEGMRLVLKTSRKAPRKASRKLPRRASLAGLMKHACGAVDSGVADLASNAQHLADFGRDGRRYR
jgi:hypothetical protein